VAANVLAVARREMNGEEAMLREESLLLAPLLEKPAPEPVATDELRRAVQEMNERLCLLIRQGAFDETPRRRELADVVRRLVLRKLEVANPVQATRGTGEMKATTAP
jgi:hypothetical protein